MTLTVKTLNHRFLDIKFHGAPHLGCLEPLFVQTIKKRIHRGSVEVSLFQQSVLGNRLSEMVLDPNVVKNAVLEFKKVQKKYSLKNQFGMLELLSVPDIWKKREDSKNPRQWERYYGLRLQEALKKVLQLRTREGSSLKKEIAHQLRLLERVVVGCERKIPAFYRRMRKKFKGRLQKSMGALPLDPQKFEEQIAYLLDRADVREEVVRMKSHLSVFREQMVKPGPHGKNLDFLTQEMLREFNTFGSKVQDVKLTQQVVQAKSILEKLREQLQNVE